MTTWCARQLRVARCVHKSNCAAARLGQVLVFVTDVGLDVPQERRNEARTAHGQVHGACRRAERVLARRRTTPARRRVECLTQQALPVPR